MYGRQQSQSSGYISDFSYGALITNMLILVDMSGNRSTNKVVTLFLPNIAVATNGNDSYTGTYSHPLRTINTAIAKSVSLSVNNIYVLPGIYSNGAGLASSGNGVTINASGIKIFGSFSKSDGANIYTHPTILDGGSVLSSVIYAENCSQLGFYNLIVRSGNSTGNGGGICMSSVNDSVVSGSFIHRNVATGNGGGIYISGTITISRAVSSRRIRHRMARYIHKRFRKLYQFQYYDDIIQ
jgi:predicted outer membrane repeat protein